MANVKLMIETYNHIKEHPESHVQESYRCGSGMCFAGWAAVLGGLEFYNPDPDGPLQGYVSPTPELLASGVQLDTWADMESVTMADRHNFRYTFEEDEECRSSKFAFPVIHVSFAAKKLLGIEGYWATELFNGHNNLDDIRNVILRLTGVDPEDPGNIEGLVQGEY